MSESFLETIKAVDGEVYNINYHQQRYEQVLVSVNITSFKNLLAYLNPPKDGTYRCRLIYDISSNITVSYHPYAKRIIQTLKPILDDNIEYSVKSSNRDTINKLYDQRQSCDEILIVKNSLITDTSIANIALYKDGEWFTPASPLLKGTTRERLLDDCFIKEKDIALDDLKHYSKLALMNAMIDFDIIASTKQDIQELIC